MSHHHSRQSQRASKCTQRNDFAGQPFTAADLREEPTFVCSSGPPPLGMQLWGCIVSVDVHERLGTEEVNRRTRAVQRLEPYDLRLSADQVLVARLVMAAEDSADACRATMQLAKQMGVEPEGVAAFCFSDDHLDMRFVEGHREAECPSPEETDDDPLQVPGEDLEDEARPAASDRRHLTGDLAQESGAGAEWPSRLLAASTTQDEPVLCLVLVDGDSSLHGPAEQQRRREVMSRLCLRPPRLTEMEYLEGRLCVAASNARQAAERAQMLFAAHDVDLEAIYAASCTEQSFDFCSEED